MTGPAKKRVGRSPGRTAAHGNPLTTLELRFIDAYLAQPPPRNQSAAALAAGYAPKTANVAGTRLLKRDPVIAEIRRRTGPAMRRN